MLPVGLVWSRDLRLDDQLRMTPPEVSCHRPRRQQIRPQDVVPSEDVKHWFCKDRSTDDKSKLKKTKKEETTKPDFGNTLDKGNKLGCDHANHAENQRMKPRIHENHLCRGTEAIRCVEAGAVPKQSGSQNRGSV